jgi:hypothetical protein
MQQSVFACSTHLKLTDWLIQWCGEVSELRLKQRTRCCRLNSSIDSTQLQQPPTDSKVELLQSAHVHCTRRC